MSDSELRQDPVLSVVFNRGWNACAEAVSRTATRRPDHDNQPKKRKKSNASTSATAPAATTRPQVQHKERVPLPPPSCPATGGDKPSTARKNPSTPGNRTTATPAASGAGAKETAKQRNLKRFQDMIERRKARKAKASSQQHRLAKHPEPNAASTSHCLAPPGPQSSPVQMEVDQPEQETATTSPSAGSITLVSPRRDVDDIYLDEPVLSLPYDDDLEAPPSFRDD